MLADYLGLCDSEGGVLYGVSSQNPLSIVGEEWIIR